MYVCKWSGVLNPVPVCCFLFNSRPETSFLWFTSPWKTFKHIIWKHWKWYIIGFFVFLLLAVLIGLFIYAAPVSQLLPILVIHLIVREPTASFTLPANFFCELLAACITCCHPHCAILFATCHLSCDCHNALSKVPPAHT